MVECDEILLASSGSSPTDLAFSEKLRRGEFIKTNENEGGSLPNWARQLLSIVTIIVIIVTIVGLCVLFFIDPMATLIIVAVIMVCLIMLAAMIDGL